MVVFKFVLVIVDEVLEISVTEANELDVELCHFVIAPVYPLNVRVVLFVPSQTEDDPEIVPPTEVGLITTVETVELMSVLQEEAAPDD